MPGEAPSPPIDAQFTIEPPPVGIMALMACLVPSTTPFRFTLRTRSYSSSGSSASIPKPPIPATLSTASTRPKVSRAAANIASTSALDADVALARHDPVAELGGGLVLLAGHIGGEDLGALPDEHLCRRPSHPGACSGDDRHLPVQLSHALPSFARLEKHVRAT